MRTVVFADLDDTLISSARKQPDTENLSVAAYDKHQQPVSFLSTKQQKFLECLTSNFEIIPVTARNFSAFSRVTLDVGTQAILNFGGSYLQNGKIRTDWLMDTWSATSDFRCNLPEIQQHLIDIFGTTHVHVVEDSNIPMYIAISSPGTSFEEREQNLREKLPLFKQSFQAERVFRLCYYHQNGRQLAIIPNSISKQAAVRRCISELKEISPELLTVGFGDSLTDLDFLHECDYGLWPTQSQIAERLKALFGY